jgi:hypothetical protein
LNGIDAFEAMTDAKGIAEFRIAPAEIEPSLSFSGFFSGTSEYVFSERVELDPTEKSSYFRVVARHRMVLPIRVTYADGRPAVGAEITSSSRSLTRPGRGSWNSLTDGDGMSHAMPAQEDSYFTASAQSGRFAAPLVACLARVGQPAAPLHLMLRPATRVHGTLTAGKDRRPVAKRSFSVLQRDDANAQIPKDQLPPRGPGPDPLPIRHLETTDEQGHFEFFAAPGRYYLDDNGPVLLDDRSELLQHGRRVARGGQPVGNQGSD